MTDKMNKILIVGLGSMGKRRIRNLQHLGFNDIVGFDTRNDRLTESERKYHIVTTKSFDESITNTPDLMIISTPPDHHLKFVKFALI